MIDSLFMCMTSTAFNRKRQIKSIVDDIQIMLCYRLSALNVIDVLDINKTFE